MENYEKWLKNNISPRLLNKVDLQSTSSKDDKEMTTEELSRLVNGNTCSTSSTLSINSSELPSLPINETDDVDGWLESIELVNKHGV